MGAKQTILVIEDEEKHRRQRVSAAELDAEVLARERRDVGEVCHASATR